MHIRPHERLIVWKEAHSLCLFIYEITKNFPSNEKFGLISQMRRAAYSIPMNIAEGNMKRSPKEKSHYFKISIGSLEETHYQAVLSRDLGYMENQTFQNIDDRIQRVSYLLTKLRAALS